MSKSFMTVIFANHGLKGHESHLDVYDCSTLRPPCLRWFIFFIEERKIMAQSLIDLLPKIVVEGKKEVERIFERLESNNKILLQTNEYVLPIAKNKNL